MRRIAVLALAALLLLPLAGPAAADGPAVRLSAAQAGTGGSVTVHGSGWRPRTLLTLLVCGRATPSRGVVGGTSSCANADGRAVTTDGEGAFAKRLPVAEPPVPCPCVVHVATVTGAPAQADAVLDVAGHPVAPLPAEPSGGRLSILSDTRLTGSGSPLTWFGAPPARTLVFTAGNLGTTPVEDPVFQVGTAHGVFAPEWDDRQWHGTLAPGKKAQIELPVELSAGAHGDYTVTVKYDGKLLAQQPWGVGRPWGVTLFWLLLCLVVPAALFRAGMAVVDRVRPGRPAGPRPPRFCVARPARRAKNPPRESPSARSPAAALPWFAPGEAPGPLRAPHADDPTGRTPPTRKGPT
ncbi:hypothetical protein [Streptomyces malaysiense]|uniref:Neocarzinostatin family protein n=1 Tax=Streptomyces malaysiense TaxID=1428626 RepID=A0A1J4PRS7_9ACTN|nr:hypothetical protein [Streptomyces malaysiense]OIK23621.1 hypothetical protein VT52_031680 [Streptomyces malaysiense]